MNIFKISQKYNLNLAQMSLKFCEIQPFMTSVIIGATTMEQLKINIESVNVDLSEKIIKEINEITKNLSKSMSIIKNLNNFNIFTNNFYIIKLSAEEVKKMGKHLKIGKPMVIKE